MEKPEGKWEEEEVETEGLQRRRTQNRNHTDDFTSNRSSSSVIMSNGNGNGDTFSGDDDDSSVAAAEELKISDNESLINGFNEEMKEAEAESGEEDGAKSSKKCVYYQSQEGLWKCRKCSWTYQTGSISSDDIQNSKQHLHKLTNVKTVNQQGQCFTHETEGTGFTNGLALNEHSSVKHSGPEKDPDDSRLDVTIQCGDIGKCLSPETNLHYDINLKHNDSLSGPTLPSSEISLEEDDTSLKASSYKAVESADIDLINVNDSEVPELDLEGVLKEQDTHDLYCPNCNSCITRRVILCKRKRHLRTSEKDIKCNKSETIVGSETVAISAGSTSDPARDPVDIHLDGNVPPASNDYDDQERQPDVFRCLSCFSIFIPTGNSFKLFQIFGDKSEKENIDNPQQIPIVKKNSFSSIFKSNKERLFVKQGIGGRADVETDNIEVRVSSNLNTQNGEASSIHEGPTHAQTHSDGEPVDSWIGGSTDSGYNILPSSTKRPAEPGKSENTAVNIQMNLNKQNGEVSLVDEASSNATYADGELVKSATTGSKESGSKILLPSSSKLPAKQGKQMIGIGEKSDNVEEAAENATLPQQNDLKFLIPSDVSSFTVENSKADQKVNVAIPKKSSDEETVLMQTPVSVSDSKGNMSVHISLDNEQNIPATFLNKTVAETENGGIKINGKGKETIIVVDSSQVETAAAQRVQDISVSTETQDSPHIETQIHVHEQRGMPSGGIRGLDIIKSIVYGGLVESITSLGVVASAAGADAATLNVLALGLANLIGGLIVIGHNLWELRADHTILGSNQLAEQVDRYQELLGQRRDFWLHVIIASLSFIVFGLLPPVIYGFSFRKTNNRDLKLVAVAGASLLAIVILAAGKAYVKRPPKSYIKTILYYVVMGLTVSGVSYAVGNLIEKFLERLSFFHPNLVVTLPEIGSKPAWASY